MVRTLGVVRKSETLMIGMSGVVKKLGHVENSE